jgi:hypothetical protein
VTGIRAAVRAGHQACPDEPPWQVEPVNPMAGGRLQPRRDRDPARTGESGPGHGGDGADGGAVGQQHQAKMPLGGADRGQHAELSQAALGDDYKAGRGDQGDQQQDHRGQAQHACGGGRPLGLGGRQTQQARMAGRARLESATVAPWQGGCPVAAGQNQHRHRFRRVGGRGRQQGELVVQVARVLDKTDDGSRGPAEDERGADADLEGRRHRVGDRDLAGGGRVAARSQPQHRRAVGAVRVLGPELEGLDRARNRYRPVADHLDGAEPRSDRRDLRVQPAWIGLVEVEAMVGRAESGVGGWD